ncbi:endonuclease YncB(thermonuclease family) [Pseudorhizobium tarimense]|uniref:Endonuclease YncB(Thermonuclease family) n=1 Tax=Pseudorhizobium tarimense TaxID=1079109 RepID=A0ABV2H4E2_9HYPH|nr:hypothetical protein [Pseudorhizobium tarimense]MCJ8518640.1 hypothetical protein [Pseudorhizobium tarimense]
MLPNLLIACFDTCLGMFLLRNITGTGYHFRTCPCQSGGDVIDRIVRQVCKHQSRSLGSELVRYGLANTGACPSDDGNLAVESSGHFEPP